MTRATSLANICIYLIPRFVFTRSGSLSFDSNKSHLWSILCAKARTPRQAQPSLSQSKSLSLSLSLCARTGKTLIFANCKMESSAKIPPREHVSFGQTEFVSSRECLESLAFPIPLGRVTEFQRQIQNIQSSGQSDSGPGGAATLLQ